MPQEKLEELVGERDIWADVAYSPAPETRTKKSDAKWTAFANNKHLVATLNHDCKSGLANLAKVTRCHKNLKTSECENLK